MRALRIGILAGNLYFLLCECADACRSAGACQNNSRIFQDSQSSKKAAVDVRKQKNPGAARGCPDSDFCKPLGRGPWSRTVSTAPHCVNSAAAESRCNKQNIHSSA